MQLNTKKTHKKAKICSLQKPLKVFLTDIDIPVILFSYSGAVLNTKRKSEKKTK